MALEQGLYAKIIMICRRNLYDIKEKDKTKIFNFQGKSARTKHWFDLDNEWLKENVITGETDFYKNMYQDKFKGDTTHDYQIIGVPIGNAKMTKNVQLHTEAPLINFQKNS